MNYFLAGRNTRTICLNGYRKLLKVLTFLASWSLVPPFSNKAEWIALLHGMIIIECNRRRRSCLTCEGFNCFHWRPQVPEENFLPWKITQELSVEGKWRSRRRCDTKLKLRTRLSNKEGQLSLGLCITAEPGVKWVKVKKNWDFQLAQGTFCLGTFVTWYCASQFLHHPSWGATAAAKIFAGKIGTLRY